MKNLDLITVLHEIRANIDLLLAIVNAKEKFHDAGNTLIKEFIAERLQVIPGNQLLATAIRVDFIRWCQHKSPEIIVPNQKRLGAALREAGFCKRKAGGRIVYINARLTTGLDLCPLDSIK